MRTSDCDDKPRQLAKKMLLINRAGADNTAVNKINPFDNRLNSKYIKITSEA